MNHTDKCIDLLSGRKNESKPLAQIAEMESAEKPLTWNERINQMTVEEKIKFLMSFENCANSVNPSFKCYESIDCDECLAKFLNSPYTEGEKE